MKLNLNVSTVDSFVNFNNYPAGNYILNVINQGLVQKFDHSICKVRSNNYLDDGIGLSRSRNYGLRVADGVGALVLIGDNDVYYRHGFDALIKKAYLDYDDADVILFKVQDASGKDFRKYPKLAKTCAMRDILSSCSIEISFKRKSIEDAGIKFDECFGLNSRYDTGEDIIFLADCLKFGLKIIFVPEIICEHPLESSGNSYTCDKVLAKGAMFRRIFGPVFGPLVITIFCMKKFRKFELRDFRKALLMGLQGAIGLD